MPQKSLFATIVPNPTGNNALEDFLRAADLSRQTEFGRYVGWLGAINRPGVNLAEYSRPDSVTATDLDLTVKQKWVRQYSKILDLVKVGNSKEFYDPRKLLPETLFPELASYRQIARFEMAAARVSFAAGGSQGGVDRILDTLTLSEKISAGSLISRLVAITCTAIVFRDLDNYWPQLSLFDAQAVEDYCAARLAERSPLIRALEGEKSFARNSFASVLKDPAQFGGLAGPGSGQGSAEGMDASVLRALKSADVEKTRAAVSVMTDKFYEDWQRLLADGPESRWINGAKLEEEWQAAHADPTPANVIASILLPVVNQAVMVEAKERAQLRLVRLTARAAGFRWEHGRLPTKLEEFTTESQRQDPAGGKFVYKVVGNWFSVERIGSDEMGLVTIRQRSVPKVSTDVPDKP